MYGYCYSDNDGYYYDHFCGVDYYHYVGQNEEFNDDEKLDIEM